MTPRGFRSRTAQEVGQPYEQTDGRMDTLPDLATSLRVGLTGLKNLTFCFRAGADPYIIIHCEGKSVKSAVKKDTLKPEFKTSAVFYRKKPRKPIIVEVRENTIHLSIRALSLLLLLRLYCHIICSKQMKILANSCFVVK